MSDDARARESDVLVSVEKLKTQKSSTSITIGLSQTTLATMHCNLNFGTAGKNLMSWCD